MKPLDIFIDDDNNGGGGDESNDDDDCSATIPEDLATERKWG